MTGLRKPLKTGVLVLAGLLLVSSMAQGAYPILRYRGYYRPGYYGQYYRGFGYYGAPYGYRVVVSPGWGWGYSGFGPFYGGYSMAYGGYGYPAPSYGSPLGGYSYPSPSYDNGNPVPYTNPPATTESDYPPPPQSTPQRPMPQRQLPPPTRDPQEEAEPARENTAHLTVVVPDGTELWFNGTKTGVTGTRREFDTPPLTPGETYRYTIKARWSKDGKPVEIIQEVKVQANSSQVIDFTKIPAGPAPEREP